MSATWENWQNATRELTTSEKIQSFVYLVGSDQSDGGEVKTSELVKELPTNRKKALAAESLTQLDNESRESVIQSFSLPAPGQKANNSLWMIFVSALSLVFVVAAVSLIYGMFFPMGEKTYFVKAEVIFTVWSTVTAYLVGLFSPSPKT